MARSLPILLDRAHREQLRGTCERCAGFCCVALAFDRGEAFAFDKPANEPCRHLSASARCVAHESRAERGLSGCIGYDCDGAGQHVTERYLPFEAARFDLALNERGAASR